MDLIIGLIFNGGLILTALFILFVNNQKVKIIVPTVFLSIYIIVLIVGVTSNISIGDSIKISYDFTGKWAQKDIIWSPIPESMWGFLTNITMLVPIGLYIGAVCKKPLLKSVIIGFATGFFIELVQFIFPIPRFPQVSDIWLNGVSTILGCLYSMLFVWIKTKLNNKISKKAEKLSTVVSPQAKNAQEELGNNPEQKANIEKTSAEENTKDTESATGLKASNENQKNGLSEEVKSSKPNSKIIKN